MFVNKKLICTLGPSSLNARVISALEATGVTSFRINMSHTDIADLDRVIRIIKDATRVPICIDTEGAQIRTGAVRPGVSVAEGDRVRLVSDPIEGDGRTFSLTPGFAVERFSPGTLVSIDFDSVLLRVDSVEGGVAEGTVLTGGEIGSRKAVTAHPSPQLPTFTEKDLLAIRMGMEQGIREYALSFCDHPTAVARLREMVGEESRIIAKIESREGVRNLSEIARMANGLLIDRGDLSREVRLEAIPLLQKSIVRKANAIGVPVYVATNLLESMVTRRAPTRAEVNDVINTLLDGASGLVLAAETAIGKYPVEAARMIAALLREYEGSIEGYHIGDLLGVHPLEGRRDSALASAPPNTKAS